MPKKNIIGCSRYKVADATEGTVEIGWSFLGRSYWGGFYNHAFKKLMVNHALHQFDWVIFYVNPKNYRSQKAMEKLGARRMSYPDETWVLEETIGVTYAINFRLKEYNSPTFIEN